MGPRLVQSADGKMVQSSDNSQHGVIGMDIVEILCVCVCVSVYVCVSVCVCGTHNYYAYSVYHEWGYNKHIHSLRLS